jgi:tetratricopeptide (TPR) repeat protein
MELAQLKWYNYYLSLPSCVFVLAKVEKDIAAGNNTTVYNVHSFYIKGLILDNLGNHTGAIEYFDKALSIYPKDLSRITGLDNDVLESKVC